MRKILMNEKGEFDRKSRADYPDYFRASAVKMMAALIQSSEKDIEGKEEVIISNKALQRSSR